MKILSWNVAGIRALLKKKPPDFIIEDKYDIICLQETKALEEQVVIPDNFKTQFPYRYWGENLGVTQRKGLSGTCIWSHSQPIRRIPTMDMDIEGRITALEFEKFNLVTVYTPNSQNLKSERCMFRTAIWDAEFKEYITELNKQKPTIICGDLNVADQDIDIYSPDKHRNCSAGFLNIERQNFRSILKEGFVDAFREKHQDEKFQYTYWDQIRPHMRLQNKGWRIDYFLVSIKIAQSISDCAIHPNITGSDHCPLSLTL